MNGPRALMASMLLVLPPLSAFAHNADTHRDVTAYAFELMAVARSPEIARRFAGDAEMTQFLAEVAAATRRLEALPADLPAPHRDRCFDLKVMDRFSTFSPIAPSAHLANAATFPVPVDLQYFSNDKSCGVDPYWRAGTLFRHDFPSEQTHAGNVLGFWAAYPDTQFDDVALEVRASNTAGVAQLKQIAEAAGGIGAGTVWVSVKCLAHCGKGLVTLDFDNCKKCFDKAFKGGKQAVHDGIASLDGLVPGIPLGDIHALQELASGMCHHIDVKGDVVVPGWSTVYKPHYDDVGGLYGLTPGPLGIPGSTEEVAIAITELFGISLDYDRSRGATRYEILDGQDFHANTVHRRKQDWEYLTWPHVPMPPLDNLSKYGWDEFRASVAKHRQDNRQPIQTRYLGWVLHGLGDATVPMHATGTFAWGHRPYEDAESRLGRQLLGEMSEEYGAAAEEAELLLRAALVYRKEIVAWRALHPELGKDIPVRDLVTTLANKTLAAAAADPGTYNDTLSTAWNMPVHARGEAISAYTSKASFMRDRLHDTVAATIAFLMSVAEDVP